MWIEAVLKSSHNVCFEQKIRKRKSIFYKFENLHFHFGSLCKKTPGKLHRSLAGIPCHVKEGSFTHKLKLRHATSLKSALVARVATS